MSFHHVGACLVRALGVGALLVRARFRKARTSRAPTRHLQPL